MRYLGRQVNGQATRNNFIRSMDLAVNTDADAALAAYSEKWFASRKKQYLNEAVKQIMARSLFWPRKAFHDMVDEILLDYAGDDQKDLARDADILKSKYTVWCQNRKAKAVTDEDLIKAVKNFENKYKYACPDTYRSCWMNTGAYVTLCYGVKYEGIMFPGCKTPDDSLALLKKFALEVIADMDHDVDERLFRLCHAVYAGRLRNGIQPIGEKK